MVFERFRAFFDCGFYFGIGLAGGNGAMGQPLDPLNGRLVAYDQLLDFFQGKASTDFASGSSGARWEKRPV